MKQIDQAEELKTDPDSNEDVRILYDSINYMIRQNGAAGYFDYYGTMEDLLMRKGVTFGELCRWADMLGSFPYYSRFPLNDRDCIVVHAGFCEDMEIISGCYGSREEFFLYAREEALELGGIRNGLIVAGHTPTIVEGTPFYTDGEVYRYHDEVKDCVYYDIDCGCVFYETDPSATLACLRLEDEEVFYL